MRRFFTILAVLLIAFLAVYQPPAKQLAWLVQKHPDKVHQYLELNAGKTHYQDSQKPGNFTLVLVHGVSGPMQAWDFNFKALANNQNRVIRFDLLGRGFSERVTKAQTLGLYVSQLSELLASLKVDNSQLVLVGSSMGAIVCSEYTRRNPNKVRGLVLIGPAGFEIQVPALAKLRDVPILGNLVFKFFGQNQIIQQNEKYFFLEEPRKQYLPFFKDQLKVRATKWAMLSTMRNVPVTSYTKQYADVGKLNIPTNIIWGKNDETFSYHHSAYLTQVMPHASLTSIENSAHLPQYEYPDRVNSRILDFLETLSRAK